MRDRCLEIRLLLKASGLWAGLFLFGGCASGPDLVADEQEAESMISDESSEDLPAPLQEQDRQDRVADDPVEQVAEQDLGDASQSAQEVSQAFTAAFGQADGNSTVARQLMEKTLERQPNCYQCAYNLGVLWESEGKWSEAIRAYKKALAVRPTHVPTVFNLSNLQLRFGKVGRAKKIVENAVRKAPKDTDLRCQLIRVLLVSRSLQSAVEQAKGVLLVDERNVKAMILLARAYYEWGKYELAERILLKAKDIDSKVASVYNMLGFVYLKMDKLNTAIESFKKAVDLDPNQAEARNNLGVLYQKTHNFETATEHLRRAVAVAPGFYEAYLNLGNSLRGHRSYREAEQAYRKALKLRPNDHRAFFNLGLMYLDDDVPGYKMSDRYKMAVKQLEEFRQKGGQDPKLDGYIKEAKKKYERALKTEAKQLKKEDKEASQPRQKPVSGEPGG